MDQDHPRRGSNQAGYFYYQNDPLGTPQKIIDGQGQSVWSQKATAFGETTVDPAATISNNLRFPRQYFDAETDRHYNGFRDYDPGVGRYSESDPIGLEDGLNIYAYGEGNPISYIDPFGLEFEKCALKDYCNPPKGLSGWAKTLFLILCIANNKRPPPEPPPAPPRPPVTRTKPGPGPKPYS